MYRKDNPNQLTFQDFYLPFGSYLRADNRWVILARQIPRDPIEGIYGEQFCRDNGCPAKSARMALGALLKEQKKLQHQDELDHIAVEGKFGQAATTKRSERPQFSTGKSPSTRMNLLIVSRE